jgi:4,5-dihydroxyphthalate decarboxylase
MGVTILEEKQLSIAMSKSDRTNAVLSGQAHLPNFTFETKSTNVEEIFVNQAAEACYDIAEMSLASYLIGLDRGETRLTAIPVFLSRSFRHNALYVREDSNIIDPRDLRHRKIGLPEYQMTAAVWVRAYFRHEWNVPVEDISWITYRPERIPLEVPAERSGSNDLFEGLISGEVDAIMSARRPPEKYFSNSGKGTKIRRLIPDVWNNEREYYRSTGIFPIMHLVSLKQETVEKYPELPGNVYKLMENVKRESVNNLFETVKNATSIPFLWEAAESSSELMGEDIWPYGLKENWKQIELFIEYLKEDGLIKNRLSAEQVFASGVLNT